MNSMKRNLMVLAIAVCTVFAVTSNIFAFSTETFTLYDHPLTINHPPGNTDPWGLTLGGGWGGQFDFQNVNIGLESGT